ncbi:MAG: hypothetical protein Q3M30_08840 [Candidatus Electrothrix sp. Rat3]|nr:hypothetical protein [Candidatus Electrothrix rattekaaiensis]
MVLKMFLVQVDLAGVCFVFGITEETALRWLKRAAKQAIKEKKACFMRSRAAQGAWLQDQYQLD